MRAVRCPDRAIQDCGSGDRVTVFELKRLLDEVPDHYIIMDGHSGERLALSDNLIIDEDEELWL
jgi:hypothetical protein